MQDEKVPVKGKIALIVFLTIAGLIVFVGMLGSAYMSGLLQYEKTNHSRNYAHQTSKEIEKCGANPHAIDVANCIEKIIKSHNEHQRAEDDRIAQSDMARWALWMTIFTFGTLLVTAAGVILIYKTMRFTGETLALAKTTNDATWEAVEVTRNVGNAQARAYLTCTGGKIRTGEHKGGHPCMKLVTNIKNSGQTPAFGTRISARIWSSSKGTLDPFDVTAHSSIIGADGEGEAESHDYIFRDHPHSKILQSGEEWCVMGVIYWRDVFGEKHETEFELRQIDTGGMNENMGIVDYKMEAASTIMRINGHDIRHKRKPEIKS